MLDIIGSVASILGLAIAVKDQSEKLLGTKLDERKSELLSMLAFLSKKTSSWKTLHKSYFPIGKEFDNLINIITKIDSGRRILRRPSDIRFSEVHEFFTGSGLISAERTQFEIRHRPFINTITHQQKMLESGNKEEALKYLRDKGDEEVAEALETIIESQKSIINKHNKTAAFFSIINKMVMNNAYEWKESEIETVTAYYGLLSNDFPSLLNDIDAVLLAHLELYIKFTDGLV